MTDAGAREEGAGRGQRRQFGTRVAVRAALRTGVWLTLALPGLAAGQGGDVVPAGSEIVSGGRFTFIAMPSDAGLARHLLVNAIANDTFPGLPRPQERVAVYIAPSEARFREWAGAGVPEWGVAVAFPGERRIVMHGRSARAGDPRTTLRHELGHLALHEFLGSLPPVWFDEGYASFVAREWSRDQVLESSVILALDGVPRFAGLDTLFSGGTVRAERGYALAQRAVADMAALDPQRGLTLLFQYWIETRSLDAAMRQAYGVTLGGFEDEWRRTTRRRYGGLALFADLGFVSLVFLVVVGPLWMARRRRDRARLGVLRAADEAMARREAADPLAGLLPSGEQKAGNEDQIKGR